MGGVWDAGAGETIKGRWRWGGREGGARERRSMRKMDDGRRLLPGRIIYAETALLGDSADPAGQNTANCDKKIEDRCTVGWGDPGRFLVSPEQ